MRQPAWRLCGGQAIHGRSSDCSSRDSTGSPRSGATRSGTTLGEPFQAMRTVSSSKRYAPRSDSGSGQLPVAALPPRNNCRHQPVPEAELTVPARHACGLGVQHGCPGREDRVEGSEGHQRDHEITSGIYGKPGAALGYAFFWSRRQRRMPPRTAPRIPRPVMTPMLGQSGLVAGAGTMWKKTDVSSSQ